MRLEEGEQRERPGLPHAVGAGPEHAHEDEYRGFHHHPSDAVRDGWSVAAVEQVAVAGFEEVQRHEHPERRDGHDDKENVETLFHRRPGYSRRINTVKVVFFSGPGKSSGPGRLSVSSGNGADSSERKTETASVSERKRRPSGALPPGRGACRVAFRRCRPRERRPPGRRGGCTRAPGRAGCAGRVSACKPCPSVSRFSRTGGATAWGNGAFLELLHGVADVAHEHVGHVARHALPHHDAHDDQLFDVRGHRVGGGPSSRSVAVWPASRRASIWPFSRRPGPSTR